MTPRRRLFHLVLPQRWDGRAVRSQGQLAPTSLGHEGFVHLSLGEQLQGTLEAHFKGQSTLLLFEVELGDDVPELCFEASRDGALFPHLYRPLRSCELVRRWTLRSTPRGWSLPLLGSTAAEDRPSAGDPFGDEEED